MLTVLTAITGRWEAPLVSGLEGGREVVVVRRCVDLPELLAAAGAGQARAVVLSADLQRLDREALDRLAHIRTAVVGLAAPGDEHSERRLRQLGVRYVLSADAPAAEVAAAIGAAVRELDAGGRGGPDVARADPADALTDPYPGGIGGETDVSSADTSTPDPEPFVLGLPAVGTSDPTLTPSAAGESATEKAAASDAAPTTTDDAATTDEAEPGRLIAVWGPIGSPGRTTIAITLAAELAQGRIADGQRGVLLADVDTYGACIAQALGVLDEAPGVAAATRAAQQGLLDQQRLARLAPEVSPGLRVLTGITRSHRWIELRPSGIEAVWQQSRRLARFTVADCGFSLEQDEELSYDTAAPRRNGATLTTLAQADVIVVVGSADPIGLQRLVRGIQDLREVVPQADITVVVNRVRASAVGPDPETRVREALLRYAGIEQVVMVPDDRGACDAAMLAGRSLTESAPRSAARSAVAALAGQLSGRAVVRRGLAGARRAAAGAR